MAVDVLKTKKINRESDLDNLVVGNKVRLYIGHNYGELNLLAEEMFYVAGNRDGEMVFSFPNRRPIKLYRSHVSVRDGIIVHPRHDNMYDTRISR